jgi:uncharacterized protein
MQLLNSQRKTVIASKARLADSAGTRLVGLLNRSGIESDEALVITACRSIHMFFMRFAIDVIFADKQRRVIGVVPGIKPFRLSPYFWRAYYAIEGPVGMIQRSQTEVGDEIVFND